MKTLRCVLFSLSLLLPAAHGYAQIVEAYGTLAVDQTHVELLPYSSSQFNDYTGVGFSGGATLNFIPTRVINVGIDVNGTKSSGVNFWLAGLEIKAKPPFLPIKPYFKLAVGEAYFHESQTFSSSIPASFVVDNYIYNAALGVDYRLNHFIDFRVVEIGDGRTLGAGASNPTSLLTIHSGIVIHL